MDGPHTTNKSESADSAPDKKKAQERSDTGSTADKAAEVIRKAVSSATPAERLATQAPSALNTSAARVNDVLAKVLKQIDTTTKVEATPASPPPVPADKTHQEYTDTDGKKWKASGPDGVYSDGKEQRVLLQTGEPQPGQKAQFELAKAKVEMRDGKPVVTEITDRDHRTWVRQDGNRFIGSRTQGGSDEGDQRFLTNNNGVQKFEDPMERVLSPAELTQAKAKLAEMRPDSDQDAQRVREWYRESSRHEKTKDHSGAPTLDYLAKLSPAALKQLDGELHLGDYYKGRLNPKEQSRLDSLLHPADVLGDRAQTMFDSVAKHGMSWEEAGRFYASKLRDTNSGDMKRLNDSLLDRINAQPGTKQNYEDWVAKHQKDPGFNKDTAAILAYADRFSQKYKEEARLLSAGADKLDAPGEGGKSAREELAKLAMDNKDIGMFERALTGAPVEARAKISKADAAKAFYEDEMPREGVLIHSQSTESKRNIAVAQDLIEKGEVNPGSLMIGRNRKEAEQILGEMTDAQRERYQKGRSSPDPNNADRQFYQQVHDGMVGATGRDHVALKKLEEKAAPPVKSEPVVDGHDAAAGALFDKLSKSEELAALHARYNHREASFAGTLRADQRAKMMQQAFKEDPGLFERLQHPQTEEEKRLASLMDPEKLFGRLADKYKTLASEGRLHIQDALHLDPKASPQDVLKYAMTGSKAERDDFLKDSTAAAKALGGDLARVEIMRHAFAQGELKPEDLARAVAVGWLPSDGLKNIGGYNGTIDSEYAKKYHANDGDGTSFKADLEKKLGADNPDYIHFLKQNANVFISANKDSQGAAISQSSWLGMALGGSVSADQIKEASARLDDVAAKLQGELKDGHGSPQVKAFFDAQRNLQDAVKANRDAQKELQATIDAVANLAVQGLLVAGTGGMSLPAMLAVGGGMNGGWQLARFGLKAQMLGSNYTTKEQEKDAHDFAVDAFANTAIGVAGSAKLGQFFRELKPGEALSPEARALAGELHVKPELLAEVEKRVQALPKQGTSALPAAEVNSKGALSPGMQKFISQNSAYAGIEATQANLKGGDAGQAAISSLGFGAALQVGSLAIGPLAKAFNQFHESDAAPHESAVPSEFSSAEAGREPIEPQSELQLQSRRRSDTTTGDAAPRPTIIVDGKELRTATPLSAKDQSYLEHLLKTTEVKSEREAQSLKRNIRDLQYKNLTAEEIEQAERGGYLGNAPHRPPELKVAAPPPPPPPPPTPYDEVRRTGHKPDGNLPDKLPEMRHAEGNALRLENFEKWKEANKFEINHQFIGFSNSQARDRVLHAYEDLRSHFDITENAQATTFNYDMEASTYRHELDEYFKSPERLSDGTKTFKSEQELGEHIDHLVNDNPSGFIDTLPKGSDVSRAAHHYLAARQQVEELAARARDLRLISPSNDIAAIEQALNQVKVDKDKVAKEFIESAVEAAGLPKIKVHFANDLGDNTGGNYSFETGDLTLRQDQIDGLNSRNLPDFLNNVMHEATHHEQGALIMSSIADRLGIGEMTSANQATLGNAAQELVKAYTQKMKTLDHESEGQKRLNELFGNVGMTAPPYALDPDYAQEVLKWRNGAHLTRPQAERAERLMFSSSGYLPDPTGQIQDLEKHYSPLDYMYEKLMSSNVSDKRTFVDTILNSLDPKFQFSGHPDWTASNRKQNQLIFGYAKLPTDIAKIMSHSPKKDADYGYAAEVLARHLFDYSQRVADTFRAVEKSYYDTRLELEAYYTGDNYMHSVKNKP